MPVKTSHDYQIDYCQLVLDEAAVSAPLAKRKPVVTLRKLKFFTAAHEPTINGTKLLERLERNGLITPTP